MNPTIRFNRLSIFLMVLLTVFAGEKNGEASILSPGKAGGNVLLAEDSAGRERPFRSEPTLSLEEANSSPSASSETVLNECKGDLDFNQVIDAADMGLLAADYGHTDCSSGYPCLADIDADGDVDGSDVFNLATQFGTDCTFQARVCSGALDYDTGTSGWHYAVNENYGIALRFTPPSYPWTFNLVRFWPWSNSAGLDFEVHVWDDDGPGGMPGSDLIVPVSHHALNTDTWETVSLSTISISEGDFYVGWVQKTPDLFYNGSDDGPEYNGRSYFRRPDGSWSNFVDIGNEANMMIRQSCQSSPPVLSNLQVSPATLPVPFDNEYFVVTVSFDFEDSEGDLYELVSTITTPGGTSQGGSESLQTHLTSGTAETDIWIDATYQAGSYLVSLELVDEFGNRSGAQSVTFALEINSDRPVEITGLSATIVSVGDIIQISGSGFNEDDPSANEVYFGDSLQRAQVVSASATMIEVTIPVGALSGPVRLKTPSGTTQSIASVTIQPGITMAPDMNRLLTGQTVQFSCERSGLDTSGLTWTVNGQTVPDPEFGAIDQFGSYTSPAEIPSTNPVTIRCADADYPSFYAEMDVEIVLPIPPPGGGIILARAGGEIKSVNGEATINIPPNALDSDTAIAVEPLNADVQPTLHQDADSLAAVRLEPSNLQFNQPVDITFKLKRWQPPGTEIPLVLIEDTGGLLDTGTTAAVDVSGLLATAQISHFSRYVLQKKLDFSRADLSERWNGLASEFTEYEIESPPDITFTEGLSVPVLIKRRAGKGAGPGPFFSGVTVTPVLEGYTRENTPLTVELVQPSADGWQLGTIIHIPTIPQFGEGVYANATIYVDYPALAGEPGMETMQFEIEIECLDELVFDYDQPPMLPSGAVQYTSQGRRYVRLPQQQHYRFSELHVGPQGVLTVEPVWVLPGNPRDPLTLVVAGDVTVEGQIHAFGTDGTDGQNGSGSDGGGYGGPGGNLAAGAGGIGGPTSPTKWDRDGRAALYLPYGGMGGLHGYKWDNSSWISVLIAGAEIWYSFGQIVTSPASLLPYVGFVDAFYGGVQETIKYNHKDQNRVLSAGEGGRRGNALSYYYTSGASNWHHFWTFEPYFPAPMAGGGGGGSGKMRISGEPDAAGAGGGGGGGAGPNLKIVAGGRVFFARGAAFDGHGGNGGRGGNGSLHSWSNQAAPGGGGAGGGGANLHMIAARGLTNNGAMAANGGGGALGGEIDEDEGIILLPKTFGEFGHRGNMRLDGPLSGNIPTFMGYWGAYMGEKIISSNRWGTTGTFFEDTLFFGKGFASGFHITLVDGVEVGTASGLESKLVSFQLTEGLHTLSVKQAILGEAGIYADLHPWMYQHVFCFPGLEDADQDGLPNGMETHVGSDPLDADSDEDGLPDGDEILIHQTDPNLVDTDGDGYSDPDELYVGTDPNDAGDHPGIDTDNDSLPDGWEIKHFGDLSENAAGNPDEDGLSNIQEYQLHTDPNLWDTDEDGVSDGVEVFFESDPLNPDSTPEGPQYNFISCDGFDNDLDGEIDEGFENSDNDPLKDCVDPDDDNDLLTDVEENALGTDPLDYDTDDDNLSDFSEVRTYGTNPLIADSDGDGLVDGDEILVHGTLPLDPDSDNDGLTDGEEVNTHGTNPLSPDTDSDGITDFDEVTIYTTDPLKMDTDGDGYDDLMEITAGTDPKDPNDFPGAGDVDDDGLPDQWEIDHFGDLHQGPNDDYDDDFLTNLAEFDLETDPTLADTDADGFWDKVEIDQSSDPLDENSTPEVCDGIDNDNDAQTDEGVCQSHIDQKGKDFILAFLPSEQIDPDPTVSLIITGELPTDVTISYPVVSPTWSQSVSVSRHQSAKVTVPVTASTAWTHNVPMNNALRVTSDEEITVVMKNSKAGVRDQALALPVDALGTEYFVLRQALIVATEDATTVSTYFPGEPSPVTMTLDRGEGCLRGYSGAVVRTDKPVAVVYGQDCARVPVGVNYCEHLFEMAVPTNYWSTDVLAVNMPLAYEDDPQPYRKTYYDVLALDDNTELRINGILETTMSAGTRFELLRSGDEVSSHFTATGPIFVVQYMNGLCDQFPYSDSCVDWRIPVGLGEYGDPSMTNLIHTDHFAKEYVFESPHSYVTIERVMINIVASTADVQQGRVVLDGRPVETSKFTIFPNTPEFAYASVQIWDSGLHTSSSMQGHALTVVGFGGFTAVSYPAGLKLSD